jgi:hypothetical protein
LLEGKETASTQDAMANRTYDAFLDAILTMFGKNKRTLHHGVGNGRRHQAHSSLYATALLLSLVHFTCLLVCGDLWAVGSQAIQ